MGAWKGSEVHLELRENVAVLTLDAPERRNALTVEMSTELVSACEWLDARDDVGATVIRGARGAFCAGADRALLRKAAEDPAEPERYEAIGRIYSSFIRVAELRSPTIAAIRGAAVGAGINLALAADLRIVAHDARLTPGFAQIGLHPGGGHFSLLARLVGAEAAAALGVFGEAVDGQRAKQIGLAWDSVPDHEVDGRAFAVARLAASDPALACATTASMRNATRPIIPVEVALQAERAAQMWSMRRQA